MNLPLFLARRLSLASDGRKTSPGVRVATIAVALSVTVMMAAIAIVGGFKREITSKVAGFNSDITITSVTPSESDDYLVSLTPSLRSLLDSTDYVTDYSLQIAAPAVLKTPGDFKGIYLKALAGHQLTDFLKEALEEGSLPSDSTVLISRLAANRLNLKTGDKTDIYFITDDVRVRRMRVSGIYNSHFDVYDDVYAYTAPSLIHQVTGVSPSLGTMLSVQVDDFDRLDEYSAALQHDLVQATADGLLYRTYRVENAHTSGANYFAWLQMLDMNVVIVLVLMTLVACVTLISGMLIIIVDKKRFIAVMKALGASSARVGKVFVFLAVRVAITGLIIGDILSLVILTLQHHYHFLRLDPDSYYIDFVPVEISWPAFCILNVAVLLIAYLMLVLPSRFVGSVSPAHVLAKE